MSTTISEDHRLLINAVRDYARGELLQLDAKWDREESSCCERLDQLYEMGLMGLRVPEDHGGLACPMLPYAHIIRELAYASPAVAVSVSVHTMVCEAVKMFAQDAVRDQLQQQLATPDNLSAFAVSEPDVGSDPAAVKTRAEKVPDGWKLHGSKFWVTNGLTGRWFSVLARAGDTGGNKDLSMLLLDARQDAVERRPIHGKMGIRGSETGEMNLDGAFVPAEHMLGEPGDGLKITLSALDGGRIGIASQAVGIGQACLDLMVSYAKERHQFGQPIADFQAIQWMIADSKTDLDASQLLIDQAALAKDSGRPFTCEASLAKLFASEAANRIAYRAVQVHGGSGYINECRVEQLYRDARITTIYEGTSEIQRHVIAREMLKDA
ncbi:MAG: acyl-CoA dehydrogenase family protein [Phycisphaerae bacterium]|nr:acyl-CoA dehydrogenase family protein [Phycisphaerae bacterium]